MCGIAGFVMLSGEMDAVQSEYTLKAMTRSIASRGPDGDGHWVDAVSGVALGHRRLAIIDLSHAGRQPMASADGSLLVTYNGEIYNYRTLRSELERLGVVFRSQCDTEVLVEACAHWGVAETARRLVGIFAFAAWNRKTRTLSLVRDHFGIKPLYWGKLGKLFGFASELKAIRQVPGWTPQLDLAALGSYFRHCYVPGPGTIYTDVRKLQAGSILTLAPGREPQIEMYWDMRAVARDSLAARRQMDDAQVVEDLDHLLRQAVSNQMMSDVPLGVFLSGGIDSSTIAALLQSQSTSAVRSFAVGFELAKYNEAPHAKAVANHLGTDHTELYVTSRHALDVIPSLAEMYDEPFADSSQIPTHLVCALTRKHVTVVLSGDGGDELFAGYGRYAYARSLTQIPFRVPARWQRRFSQLIRAVPPGLWDRAANYLPQRYRMDGMGDKLHKYADLLSPQTRDKIYRQLLSHWNEETNPVIGPEEAKGILWDPEIQKEIPDFTDRMQFYDTMTYLPDDILVKVDRASMAVGLEVRVPLLDPEVVSYAWHLPQSMKVRQGTTKWALREVLCRYVPAPLIDRPKMGFGVPIGEWMRGPLRDWCETLLDEKRLASAGILDPKLIRLRWQQHLSGQSNWPYALWDVLMFESWREHWMETDVMPVPDCAVA